MGTVERDATILELLDDLGMSVVLHTHHPLTHLEHGAGASAQDVNLRLGCPMNTPNMPVRPTPGAGDSATA
jgi:hypothetical protein